MAKKTIRTAVKGMLDVEELTMTEFEKDGEMQYSIIELLMPYHGYDNVSITISYDSEVDN